MGYRDDFYIKKNIIGYTGTILSGSLPSIYFYDPMQYAFGCITQCYYMQENIGREPVLIDKDYLIFNLKGGGHIQQSALNLRTTPRVVSDLLSEKIRRFKAEFGNTNLDSMVECYCSDIRNVSRHRFRTLGIGRIDDDVRENLSEAIKNNKYPPRSKSARCARPPLKETKFLYLY